MSSSNPSTESLPPPPVERFRDYLVLLARSQLGSHLQGKMDASDLVQQVLLEAHRDLDQFQGQTDQEMTAWLRGILAHCLAKQARWHGQAKRQASRERSLQFDLDQTSARLENLLAATQPSPSSRADVNEKVLRLIQALADLPASQREAMTLRHLEDWPIAAISEKMACTPPAVIGLLKRGTRRLRQALGMEDTP